MARGCTGSALIMNLKLPEKSTLQSLEKLLDAHMIYRPKGMWVPAALKKYTV